MSKAVLAATIDGRVTYCTCPPEQRGKGRCNHVFHQEEGETESQFMERIQQTESISSYHMSDEEKENLMPIKGRTDLEKEDCEGGYIHVDTPVWSPSNIKEYAELSGTKESAINGLISRTVYWDEEEGRFVSIATKTGIDKQKKAEFDANPDRYKTGVGALNDLAAEDGYTATTDIYVLPYYMRQDTENAKNPLNVHYNSIIVTNNSKKVTPDKLQETYERLLDNKNVKKHGFTPLTKHGGYALDSLSDLVNGKSGIMRGYITGFSIPYSGRAVISPNIRMKYGEVGIPASMAVSIFEPTIRTRMKSEGYSDEDISKFISRVGNGKGSHEDKVMVDRILTSEDRKVLVNRQPSLHMGSMVCFKARVTEIVDSAHGGSAVSANDTIQLNPMLAKGFNADFDGDTQAVYAINDKEIGEDAWSEMSPFTEFISHNPKNMGESMTVPTKDCLFGLFNILGVGNK